MRVCWQTYTATKWHMFGVDDPQTTDRIYVFGSNPYLSARLDNRCALKRQGAYRISLNIIRHIGRVIDLDNSCPLWADIGKLL